MISISNLIVKKAGHTILSLESLKVAANEKVLIYGTNGSGKTTLLRVIANLEKDFDGKLECSCVQKDLTYLHQEPICFRGTVRENIRYGMSSRSMDSKSQIESVMHWVDLLGIRKLRMHNVKSLSGGEKKKVAIARAMVLNPRLVLLDEPLAELDQSSGKKLVDALVELKTTTVIATSPVVDERFQNFRLVKV